MCTGIKFGKLFGRTLDLECSYGESIVIMPRNFSFRYLHNCLNTPHHAIIGIAHISQGVPLFYDGINERGVGIAGLNFPKNAIYQPHRLGFTNIASFELIPWLLSKCHSIDSVLCELKSINITNDSFSRDLPSTPLHWLITDTDSAICVEATRSGLNIYENPLEVLTNNPEFPYHKTNIANYMGLSASPPENTLCPQIQLEKYSRGMGAIGLPGDFSSTSRFVRAAFIKNHIIKTSNPVCDFFHIMDSVKVPLGCIITDTSEAVSTIYTSCGDLESGVYYYNTYNEQGIKAISLSEFDLNANGLFYKGMQ